MAFRDPLLTVREDVPIVLDILETKNQMLADKRSMDEAKRRYRERRQQIQAEMARERALREQYLYEERNQQREKERELRRQQDELRRQIEYGKAADESYRRERERQFREQRNLKLQAARDEQQRWLEEHQRLKEERIRQREQQARVVSPVPQEPPRPAKTEDLAPLPVYKPVRPKQPPKKQPEYAPMGTSGLPQGVADVAWVQKQLWKNLQAVQNEQGSDSAHDRLNECYVDVLRKTITEKVDQGGGPIATLYEHLGLFYDAEQFEKAADGVRWPECVADACEELDRFVQCCRGVVHDDIDTVTNMCKSIVLRR